MPSVRCSRRYSSVSASFSPPFILVESIASACHPGSLNSENQVIVVLVVEERHQPLLPLKRLVDEQELRLHFRLRHRDDGHRAVFVEVPVVYLTVKQLRLKFKVLAVDMPEDGDIFCTALDGECDRKRVAVSSSKEAILRLKPQAQAELGNEVKGCAFLQDSPLVIDKYNHYLRDLGVLLRISLSYSS